MSPRLATDKLIDWLTNLGVTDAKLVRGPSLPDMPSRVAVVTMSGGTGLSMEHLFDNVGFQVRSRGAYNRYGDAEKIALEIDDFLIGPMAVNVEVDDVWITNFTRSGGPPTQDAAEQFVCNYLAFASTGV